MLIHRKRCAYAAAALVSAFGCGNAVSNPDGDAGPASSGASTSGGSGSGSSGGWSNPSAAAGSSATGGVPTSADAGSGTANCRLPNAQDLALDHPLSKSEALFNEVLDEQLERLYEAIGQYASGQTPLFHGRLRGLEDRTATGSSDGIVTMNTTRAVATLQYDKGIVNSPVTAGHVLTAFDPDARRVVHLLQTSSAPIRTYVSTINDFFGGVAVGATCSNCLLELAGAPDEISFDLSAHGEYLNADNTPMQVDLVGNFSRVPVDAITLEDILIVTSVYRPTTEYRSPTDRLPFLNAKPRIDGAYVVFDMNGSAGSGRDANGCSLTTYYDIEWFVRESCLLDYGVRNLVIDESPANCSQDG
jgi:hypothetical protein